MPTNDERREVAARLREMARTHYWLNLESLAYAINIDIGDRSLEEEDAFVCNRLADLIEPEPERTCHNAFENTFIGTHAEGFYSAWFECSSCGFSISAGICASGEGYCPNCGAKVTE